MSERFYVTSTLVPGPVLLQGPEAHHLAVVCRLRVGAAVTLFNGDGHEYPGHVAEVGRKQVTIEVDGVLTPSRELPYDLEVAAPLPRGDRAQFLLEKLTELGVAAYRPLQTARSVVHPREARLDRLERYVIEASKQCGRNVLLRVEPLTPWTALCSPDGTDLRVLAHPGGSPLDDTWTREHSPSDRAGKVVLAVGPEGGFTDEEADLARSAGWQVVGLGPRILRVETAALALTVAVGKVLCP